MKSTHVILRGHSEEVSVVIFLKTLNYNELYNEYFIVSGTSTGKIYIWSVLDLHPIIKERAHFNSILSINEFENKINTNFIITQSKGGEYKIWSFDSYKFNLLETFNINHMGFCRAIHLHQNDNKTILMPSGVDRIAIYNVTTKSLEFSWNYNKEIFKPLGSLTCLAPIPLGPYLEDSHVLAGFEGGTIVLFCLLTGNQLANIDVVDITKGSSKVATTIETGPVFALAYDNHLNIVFASTAVTGMPLVCLKLENRGDGLWIFQNLSLKTFPLYFIKAYPSELITTKVLNDTSSTVLIASGTDSNAVDVFTVDMDEVGCVILNLAHSIKYHTKRISSLALFPQSILPQNSKSTLIFAASSRDLLISIWGLFLNSNKSSTITENKYGMLEDFFIERCLT